MIWGVSHSFMFLCFRTYCITSLFPLQCHRRKKTEFIVSCMLHFNKYIRCFNETHLRFTITRIPLVEGSALKSGSAELRCVDGGVVMCAGDVTASGESPCGDQLLFMRQRLHRLALASFLSETQLRSYRKRWKLCSSRLSSRRDTAVSLNMLHSIPQRHQPIQWKDLRTWFGLYFHLPRLYLCDRKHCIKRIEWLLLCCASLSLSGR